MKEGTIENRGFSLKALFLDIADMMSLSGSLSVAFPKLLSHDLDLSQQAALNIIDCAVRGRYNTVIFCWNKKGQEHPFLRTSINPSEASCLSEAFKKIQASGLKIGLEIVSEDAKEKNESLIPYCFREQIDFFLIRSSTFFFSSSTLFIPCHPLAILEELNKCCLFMQRQDLVVYLDNTGIYGDVESSELWDFVHALPYGWSVAFPASHPLHSVDGYPLHPLIDWIEENAYPTSARLIPVIDWKEIPLYRENYPLNLDALFDNVLCRQSGNSEIFSYWGIGCHLDKVPKKGGWLDCLTTVLGHRMLCKTSCKAIARKWLCFNKPGLIQGLEEGLLSEVSHVFSALSALVRLEKECNSMGISIKDKHEQVRQHIERVIFQVAYLTDFLQRFFENHWCWDAEGAGQWIELRIAIVEFSEEVRIFLIKWLAEGQMPIPSKMQSYPSWSKWPSWIAQAIHAK